MTEQPDVTLPQLALALLQRLFDAEYWQIGETSGNVAQDQIDYIESFLSLIADWERLLGPLPGAVTNQSDFGTPLSRELVDALRQAKIAREQEQAERAEAERLARAARETDVVGRMEHEAREARTAIGL